jgi:histone deacetylase 6
MHQGGYNLDSVRDSALAVTRVLLGEAPDELESMVASESATETVWLVAKEQSKYWKSVDPQSCEPREGGSTQLTVDILSSLYRLRIGGVLHTW